MQINEYGLKITSVNPEDYIKTLFSCKLFRLRVLVGTLPGCASSPMCLRVLLYKL